MNLLIKQKHTDLDKEFMFTRGKGGGEGQPENLGLTRIHTAMLKT